MFSLNTKIYSVHNSTYTQDGGSFLQEPNMQRGHSRTPNVWRNELIQHAPPQSLTVSSVYPIR